MTLVKKMEACIFNHNSLHAVTIVACRDFRTYGLKKTKLHKKEDFTFSGHVYRFLFKLNNVWLLLQNI